MVEKEILEFIDSININEIEKENIDRIFLKIEQILNYSNLSKCNELIRKKFVKLSIHLIKYFHQALVEELSKYKQANENESEDLEKFIDILYKLFHPIADLSDKSIQFCNFFYEEDSGNGIKVLFDLIMDEKLLFEPKKQKNSIYWQIILQNSFTALLKISKAYYKNKDKWNNLNAYQKFLDLSKKTINEKVKLNLS
jgi:hypothetical protein